MHHVLLKQKHCLKSKLMLNVVSIKSCKQIGNNNQTAHVYFEMKLLRFFTVFVCLFVCLFVYLFTYLLTYSDHCVPLKGEISVVFNFF